MLCVDERGEHPRRHARRPGHAVTDDGHDGHPAAGGDMVDEPGRELVAERMAKAVDRAIGL